MSALLNNQPSQMLEMNNNLATVVNPSAGVAATVMPATKDSRWLTLEVCREFQRSKCSRSDQECKFAHPPPHVEVQNGRVTCCFDSIKGKCQRKDPPCKYLHPPQHLKEQLVQNGRNNLILKQLQTQALFNGMVPQALYPNTQPVMYDTNAAKPLSYATPTLVPGHPFSGGMMAPQYIIPSSLSLQNHGLLQAVPYVGGHLHQAGSDASMNGAQSVAQVGGLLTAGPNAVMAGAAQPKVPARPESHGNAENSYTTSVANDTPTTSAQSASGYTTMYPLPQQPGMVEVYPTTAPVTQAKKRPHPPDTSELMLNMPQMMPVLKRPAVADKTGMPMYPLNAQAMYPPGILAANPSLQLNAQYIPVTLAGQPAQLQHYQGAL